MISELDEIDSPQDPQDPQDSDEHWATMSVVTETPISWTYRDTVPTVVPFTSSSGIKIDISHTMDPFSWVKIFLDDN
jgi:hypothetical protein